MYCGLSFLTFGLCAITGSQARLALSVAFWILLNYKASLSHHASQNYSHKFPATVHICHNVESAMA